MKDQGRADSLFQAIEDLLAGRTPSELADEDLNQLLQTAKVRWEAARSLARASAQHEGTVWRDVLARLGRLPDHGPAEASAAIDDPESPDLKQLEGVVNLRRQMAERAAFLAEAHRVAVWKQVQARIHDGSGKRGRSFFQRGTQREALVPASAVDSLVLGEPVWEASNSRLDDLLDLARTRRGMGQAAAAAASQQMQGRLWAHLRPRLLAHLLDPGRSSAGLQRPGHAWGRLAAAGAAIALLVAAVGPIPATGLADHPLTQLVRSVGRSIGVLETGSPPVVPPPTEVVEPTDVTVAQASELLGLPVWQPTSLPEGFQPVSSRFFPKALTANEGGVFLLAYAVSPTGAAEPSSILIYQEHASGIDFAAQEGSTRVVSLADGTPATFVEGSWSASGSGVVWGADSSQTLVFDRGGLRTIIQHNNGPKMDVSELLAIAEGMAPASSSG